MYFFQSSISSVVFLFFENNVGTKIEALSIIRHHHRPHPQLHFVRNRVDDTLSSKIILM